MVQGLEIRIITGQHSAMGDQRFISNVHVRTYTTAHVRMESLGRNILFLFTPLESFLIQHRNNNKLLYQLECAMAYLSDSDM